MCPDPKNRPSCEEALAHPWLNDRQNLDQRAKNRKRHDSSYHEQKPKWMSGQHAAFIICIFVIIGSYSAMISYIFNINKPGTIIQDLKLEFLQMYDNVYCNVDNFLDIIFGKSIFDIFYKIANYFSPVELMNCNLTSQNM